VHVRNTRAPEQEYPQLFYVRVVLLGDGLVVGERVLRIIVPEGPKPDSGVDVPRNGAPDVAPVDAPGDLPADLPAPVDAPAIDAPAADADDAAPDAPPDAAPDAPDDLPPADDGGVDGSGEEPGL
jgi:hypothetical protein